MVESTFKPVFLKKNLHYFILKQSSYHFKKYLAANEKDVLVSLQFIPLSFVPGWPVRL